MSALAAVDLRHADNLAFQPKQSFLPHKPVQYLIDVPAFLFPEHLKRH
jgi:hypothetical protein